MRIKFKPRYTTFAMDVDNEIAAEVIEALLSIRVVDETFEKPDVFTALDDLFITVISTTPGE